MKSMVTNMALVLASSVFWDAHTKKTTGRTFSQKGEKLWRS